MAEEIQIGGEGTLFVGEDKVFEFELYLKSNTAVSVDLTGMSTIFDVRKSVTAPDPAILSITPSLVGVFNSVRASNTQRAQVTVTDDQMNLFKEKTYHWTWKRMTANSETVLAWGIFTPQKATAP